MTMYGTEYDFESITHYPANAFSKNSKETIIAKDPAGENPMVNTKLKILVRKLTEFSVTGTKDTFK